MPPDDILPAGGRLPQVPPDRAAQFVNLAVGLLAPVRPGPEVDAKSLSPTAPPML
jgi:hypothetical protein